MFKRVRNTPFFNDRKVWLRWQVCGLSLLTLLVFSGCATIGHDFAVPEVQKIQIGKTTQQDILTMFGSPWRTGIEDGKQMWTYGKYHYSLFSEPSAEDLVVKFDAKGVVFSYTYNTTEQSK
ncbi:MAG: hypothetical protein ABSH12_05325 [Endomicrobiales bacterium]|jgi:hypothetical protein